MAVDHRIPTKFLLQWEELKQSLIILVKFLFLKILNGDEVTSSGKQFWALVNTAHKGGVRSLVSYPFLPNGKRNRRNI